MIPAEAEGILINREAANRQGARMPDGMPITTPCFYEFTVDTKARDQGRVLCILACRPHGHGSCDYLPVEGA